MARHRRDADDSYGWLREPLRAEADRHHPDRRRIWARVEAALAEDDPDADDPLLEPLDRRQRGLRVAGAAVFTAAAVAASSVIAFQLVGGPEDTPAEQIAGGGTQTAATLPTGSPLSTGPSRSPDNGSTSVSPTDRPSSTHRPPRSGTPLVDAFGEADPNSSDAWAGDRVHLRVRRTLDQLTITIRVPRTGQVEFHQKWVDWDLGLFDFTSEETPQGLVCRFKLRPGQSLPARDYVFSVSYTHTSAHNQAKDSFRLTAAADGGSPVTRSGEFPRR